MTKVIAKGSKERGEVELSLKCRNGIIMFIYFFSFAIDGIKIIRLGLFLEAIFFALKCCGPVRSCMRFFPDTHHYFVEAIYTIDNSLYFNLDYEKH